MSDLAGLTVPGPTVTGLTEPFWKAAAEGRLVVQRCEDCGKAILYPREICPHCWSSRLAWQPARGTGRLKSFSVVHKPGHPGWLPVAPYTVGLVELDEGPTMLSHILKAERAAKVGDRVAMRPTDIGGRILPAFEIIRDGETI